MNLKKLIKHMIKLSMFYTGHTIKLLKKERLIILAYHRFLKNEDVKSMVSSPDLQITPHHFESQIELMKRYGEMIDPDQLTYNIRNNIPIKNLTWLITIDDGWCDNYSVLKQVASKYKIKPILFTATDFLDSNDLYWTQKLWSLLDTSTEYIINLQSKLKMSFSKKYSIDFFYLTYHEIILFINKLSKYQRKSIINDIEYDYKKLKTSDIRYYLTSNEIIDLADKGIEIGSHTCCHEPLELMSHENVCMELSNSKMKLETLLEKPINYISYPHSSYNEQIINIVSNYGYLASFGGTRTIKNTKSNFFNRIDISPQFSYSINKSFSGKSFLSSIANVIKSMRG